MEQIINEVLSNPLMGNCGVSVPVKPAMRFQLYTVLLVLITAFPAGAQEQPKTRKLSVGFSSGYFKTIPGERFISTGPGWQIDLFGRYAIAPEFWMGIGFFWGATPEIDSPEYDVFEPRDHPIWFESSQYYLELRFDPRRNSARLIKPYVSGRLGYTTEYSEYAGPTVSRSGIVSSLLGGTAFQVIPMLTVDLSLLYSLVFLGDAVVFDIREPESSTIGSFLSLRAGIDLWF